MPWVNDRYVSDRAWAVHVNRTPFINRDGFARYLEAERAIVEDDEEDMRAEKGFVGMLNNFLVGCDPEWAAFDANSRRMNLSAHLNPSGEIGYDHGGRVGEFRPDATKGTYALLKKLRRLVNSDTIARLRATKLRAGGMAGTDSLGGHVHLGIPCPGSATDARIKALDRVTQALEHLDILPTAESSTRRGRGSYGYLGDIRACGSHLEYRSMASWLTDPKVAYICLTAAKLAACDPEGTTESLKVNPSFADLVNWFRRYRTKDINARRAVDRVLDAGHKTIQVYPDVDFRERWRELGV